MNIFLAALTLACFSFFSSPGKGESTLQNDQDLVVYVRETISDLEQSYEVLKCQKSMCKSSHYLNHFLKMGAKNKPRIRRVWRNFVESGFEDPTHEFVTSTDQVFLNLYPDGLQNVVRISYRWMLFERIFHDLQISTTTKDERDLYAELADRAFRAHQIWRVRILSERYPRKIIEDIADVRMHLLKARLASLERKTEESYFELMRVLLSGITSDPKVLSSAVLQNQKDWMWNQLIAVSEQMKRPFTAKALQLAGPQVVFSSVIEKEFIFFNQINFSDEQQLRQLTQLFFLDYR